MDARTRYTLLMEGKPAPQTLTPTNNDYQNFGIIQTDSPQALLRNPRTSAPGVINGAFHQQQQYVAVQVPVAVALAWQGLLKGHDLDHNTEIVEALTNHLTSLESNFWQPSDS